MPAGHFAGRVAVNISGIYVCLLKRNERQDAKGAPHDGMFLKNSSGIDAGDDNRQGIFRKMLLL